MKAKSVKPIKPSMDYLTGKHDGYEQGKIDEAEKLWKDYHTFTGQTARGLRDDFNIWVGDEITNLINGKPIITFQKELDRWEYDDKLERFKLKKELKEASK